LRLNIVMSSEVIPESDTEFAAGVHQAEECVTTVASGAALRAIAEIALDDVTAKVARSRWTV
jgi:hypothetical protein